MDSPVFSLSCLFVFFVDELFFTVNIVETPESGVFLPGDKGSVYSGHYEEEILHPGRKAACQMDCLCNVEKDLERHHTNISGLLFAWDSILSYKMVGIHQILCKWKL